MTQSKAEGFAIAKHQLALIMSSAGGSSRALTNWDYPTPPDAGIELNRAEIIVLLNDVREKMLEIDTQINVLFTAQLPP